MFKLQWKDSIFGSHAALLNRPRLEVSVNFLPNSKKFPDGQPAEIKLYGHKTAVLCKKQRFKDRDEAKGLAEKLAAEAMGLTQFWLAREVYKEVADYTRSNFGEAGVASAGMYLLGAIMRGTTVSLKPRQQLTKVLKRLFAPDHAVWKHVTLEP